MEKTIKAKVYGKDEDIFDIVDALIVYDDNDEKGSPAIWIYEVEIDLPFEPSDIKTDLSLAIAETFGISYNQIDFKPNAIKL